MARFFIHRPVFAIVLSLVILIAGTMSIFTLPVAQYPQITPPTVQVETIYVGANAQVVEQSVAIPIEQEVNGAENMLYMSSKSTNDGRYVLTCTFSVGTDLNLAAVDVQNRVKKAEGKLPSEVLAYGVQVKKQSPDMIGALTIYSPDGSYDELFLSNYATINIVDRLSRVPGVGSTMIIGQRDYAMRMWLRPDKLAKLGLTASDVAGAIRDQNVQAPAGQIGQPPAPRGIEFQYTVDVKGRLTEKSEFDNMIVRALPDGSLLRIRDIARTELAAKDYASFGRLNGSPATVLIVYQSPGANALQVASGIVTTMNEAKANFPPGLDYSFTYNSTLFISASVKEVLKTLLEAMALVILVVFLFLGSFRATFIPMLAVPVSLVGTFAAFIPLGFTINTLTLFGLVLAIGIVVDDAIVVVEAVEHHIEHGLSPLAATEKAMEEVSGPVVGIALVLTAVFVPVAFMGGLTGELYRQFALTLSVSVLLSALVALTLTPALCRMLLKPRVPGTGPVAKFLGAFNRWFHRATSGYIRGVRSLIRRSAFSMALLAAIMAGAWGLLKLLPSGFVPSEDQGVIMASIGLPDGASVERTDAILRRGEEFLARLPGVRDVITMGGLNLLTGAYSSNNGSYIVTLDDWSQRHGPTLSVGAILGQLQREFFSYPEALGIAFVPPPIPGLGTAGGFQFELQDRKGGSPQELEAALRKLMTSAAQEPALTGLYSGYKTSVPMVRLDLDRDKAKQMGVPLKSIFDNLQMYLGGLQVNDFNRFGRTYKVMLQAEPEFRLTADNIERIFVRAEGGSMTPLGTLVSVDRTSGPDILQRFNLFRTAEISGSAAPGYSSGDALAAMEAVAQRELPEGFGFEWTGMAYQEKQAAGAQAIIFVLAMVFVFLVLAALYENWAIPFGVILGLPLGILGAFLGTWIRGLINDVYVQIGLIMLLGLAAKNAILIVEFAKMKREREHMAIEDAALEGSRLRFRPILMTSFAFVLGVVPLMLAGGAGSAARHSLGTAVFSGMTAATALGVLLVPVLYVVVERLVERLFRPPASQSSEAAVPTGGKA